MFRISLESRIRLGLAVLTPWLISPVAHAAPADGVFQVNTYTDYGQVRPLVASVGDEYIVVWEHETVFHPGPDGAFGSTQAQRYDSAGCAIGDEFTVNTVTQGDELPSSVAMSSNGSFVVAWTHALYPQYPGLYPSSIRIQRFDSAGMPAGGEQVVKEDEEDGKLAIDDVGDFIVAWEVDTGIAAQRFDSAGTAQAGELEIVVDDLWGFELAKAGDGSFVVVWGDRLNNTNCNIVGQRFDAFGGLLDPPFQVNTTTVGCGEDPVVEYLADDGFVIVWHRYPGYGKQVLGQTFDSGGQATGAEFEVHADGTDFQRSPRVAADPTTGGFVVSWTRQESNSSVDGIKRVLARRFDAIGQAQASEFEVTPAGVTYDNITGNDIAIGDDGALFVVWNRTDSLGSPVNEVFGRLISTDGFADGFESGDLTAWSEVVP